MLPQWVAHSDKVPIDPKNGRPASTIDPTTWADAATAWRAKCRRGLDGVGFVFTIGAGVVGIDLDGCVDGAGNFSQIARDIVGVLNSYTEFSPSGRGLHVLVLGDIPYSVKRHPGVEIYNEARYFTFTGRQVQSPGYIARRQAELSAVWLTAGGDFGPAENIRPLPAGDLPEQRPLFDPSITEAVVAEALSYVPTRGDYHWWLKMLMSVWSVFPNSTGIGLVENWSPGKPGEVARKFASFERAGVDVKIGTLFYHAKKYGFRPPSGRHRVNLEHI